MCIRDSPDGIDNLLIWIELDFHVRQLFLDCGFIIPQDKVFFCDEVTLIKKKIRCFLSTGFLKNESRFPQTVEVAVGVDRFDFITLAESEADLRLFAGMQFLALIRCV